MENPLAKDLDHVLEHTRDMWEEMRGEQLFITGGTGFFGCWLLESFQWANDRLHLGSHATILSRNPEKFFVKMPHLVNKPSINLIRGDVRNFTFPTGTFSFVINAATEASAQLNQNDPQMMLDTIIEGTQHTIEFAKTHGVKKFLLTSSGAVYGSQPPELANIPEDYQGAPDPLNSLSAYGEGKRIAELLCTLSANNSDFEMKIARCFAFVGPHLPLDAHFAIGNFIRDAIHGGPIIINGDGTPLRSYLYASDLSIWLWTILIKGKSCHAYNVGSNNPISIADLANLIAETLPEKVDILIKKISKTGTLPERYVPSVDRARTEINLSEYIDLKTAIKKTLRWLQ